MKHSAYEARIEALDAAARAELVEIMRACVDKWLDAEDYTLAAADADLQSRIEQFLDATEDQYRRDAIAADLLKDIDLD